MEAASFEDVGPQRWDAFCTASAEAWLRHTSEFIAFAETLGTDSRNVSFAIMRGEEIIGIAPLVVQQIADSESSEFAMGGSATPFPALDSGLTEQEGQEAHEVIFKEIDARAAAHNVSIVRVFVDPLIDPVLYKEYQTNPLISFGFTDTSIRTSSVDLKQGEEQLLSGIQARQRRYINAALSSGYQADFFDEKNITDEVCGAFEKLYEKAAGRVVGTPDRWRLTWDMVRKGLSVVLLMRAPNEVEYCAGHVILTYKAKAYDSLSAIAPSHRHLRGIGALMHWEIFRFLKQRGFSRFEIGLILPETSGGPYSEKEFAISHFKSLFGGELLPLWRGEKRYH